MNKKHLCDTLNILLLEVFSKKIYKYLNKWLDTLSLKLHLILRAWVLLIAGNRTQKKPTKYAKLSFNLLLMLKS